MSVGNELPNAQSNNNNLQRDASNKNEETINYEISRTTRSEVIEGGRVCIEVPDGPLDISEG